MQPQAISQIQATERSTETQKQVEEKSIGFYQLLAQLTLQQKRQRLEVRA